MQFFKSVLALAAAIAPAAAHVEGPLTAPETAAPGETISASLSSSVYVQNYDDFGIVWGLAPKSFKIGSCQYCNLVGTRIGYTNLFGDNKDVAVPDSGTFSVDVTVPESFIAGDYWLVAGASYLVGASGETGFNFYNTSITIS